MLMERLFMMTTPAWRSVLRVEGARLPRAHIHAGLQRALVVGSVAATAHQYHHHHQQQQHRWRDSSLGSRDGVATSPTASRIPTSAITRSVRQRYNLRPLVPSCLGPASLLVSQRRGLFGGINDTLLANLEELANKTPGSATAQNMFYQALIRANMPAIVVERYRTGKFASNAACEACYKKALSSIGGQDAVGAAPMAGFATASQAMPASAANLSTAQLQALAQAVAASSHNASIATPQSPTANPSNMGTSAAPFHFQVTESWRLLIFKWIRFAAFWTLSLWFMWTVIILGMDMLNMGKFPKNMNAPEAKAEHQTVRFSDVHGCNEAKEELQELVQFLKDPAKFTTLGGKLPKGVLLVGPPGTGKTLLARAVAGEAGVPFFFMSGSEFDEMYVGVGAQRIRDLFASARGKSPAIVFIDELDAIGGKRNPRDGRYANQTLNQLLTELDGFAQTEEVIILAATNFPEALDKALTRPGRFDRHVVVDLPDVRGRLAILEHHMKKMSVAEDVKVTEIAQGTPGMSGAELENLVNEAAIHASRNNAKFIKMHDLDWAKDKVLMGAERKSMVMSPKEREMTAYHEAGHALVHMYNPMATPLYKVTVMPRGHALGITSSLPSMDKYSQTLLELQAIVDVCMGGKVAEELQYGPGNVTGGCASDINQATKIAYQMVASLGMSDALGNVDLASNYDKLSSGTRAMIEEEVRRMIEEGRARTTRLLQERRKELDLLAHALLKYETLDREEAFKVVRGETLKDKLAVRLDVPAVLPGAGATVAPGGGGATMPDIPGRPLPPGEGRPPPAVGGIHV